MQFLRCVQKFSSLAWIEVCQEFPILEVHTWRMLRVPDWILGGWGHSWHHGLSWYVILDLCAKFQLFSLIRSVSRTPRPRSPYLEDIEGSWPGTWRTGSSLTSWSNMWDPQELTLKDLCQYLLIWWSYEHMKQRSKTQPSGGGENSTNYFNVSQYWNCFYEVSPNFPETIFWYFFWNI